MRELRQGNPALTSDIEEPRAALIQVMDIHLYVPKKIANTITT